MHFIKPGGPVLLHRCVKYFLFRLLFFHGYLSSMGALLGKLLPMNFDTSPLNRHCDNCEIELNSAFQHMYFVNMPRHVRSIAISLLCKC